ncbi:MAG TPA: response regulator [Streptosporangiaceae bacterium]|jgi:CheY-like chemotaxis protein|nr:response regulator [Streptosporangiaceae bacterium]
MTSAPPPGPLVLYLEDNAENVLLVERLLRRRGGTQLRVADNAHDGLAAASDERPDLILLDNHLPDATGEDVLRALSASASTARIPVVIVSGDSARDSADQLRAAGADEILIKPFNIHEFLTIVGRYLPEPADP